MFENLLGALSSLRPFAWRTALALFILTSMLLFGPGSLLRKLGISEIASQIAPAPGVLWLLCLSLLVVEIFDIIRSRLMSLYEKYKIRKNMIKFLSSLSKDEKTALEQYTKNDVSTVHFSFSGGVANALEAKGIVFRSSMLGIPGGLDTFPFSIQPVALDVLKTRPQLLNY